MLLQSSKFRQPPAGNMFQCPWYGLCFCNVRSQCATCVHHEFQCPWYGLCFCNMLIEDCLRGFLQSFSVLDTDYASAIGVSSVRPAHYDGFSVLDTDYASAISNRRCWRSLAICFSVLDTDYASAIQFRARRRLCYPVSVSLIRTMLLQSWLAWRRQLSI